MRLALLLLCVAATAHADKRITDMTPGFEREAQTCTTQVSGLEKVQAGGAAIAPTLSPEDKAQLDKDLATLADGLAGVKTYCAEVTGLVDFLKANATASYKSVEGELDKRDNSVRKLRKQSKATIDALQPITRRWIGRIAQQQTQQPVAAKPKPVTFPSGRSVELPVLPGGWKIGGSAATDTLDYADKAWSATVSVRDVQTQCEEQNRQRTVHKLDAELPSVGLVVAWYGSVETAAPKTYLEMICVADVSGARWLATIEAHPAIPEKIAELRALAMRMFVARKPR